MKRQLMRNVAKLKLQNFRHMVRGGADELSLCVLEQAVASTRKQRAPRMIWINCVLEWSGKCLVGLKVMVQDGNTWNSSSCRTSVVKMAQREIEREINCSLFSYQTFRYFCLL